MRRRSIEPMKPGEVRLLTTLARIEERVEVLKLGKRVLLPELCSNETLTYTTAMLRAVINDDNCSVLITGETGTGKEAMWDCIRNATRREKKRIMAISCAGLDSQVADSDLFGHVKGAYTGAITKRTGLIKSCEGGVIFLDEIGWLPRHVQAKLLRFMETGEFRRVGSDSVERARNVRIIAATNGKVSWKTGRAKSLGNAVDENESVLLHDLVFRFDHHIVLPPLRERRADALWFLGEPGFLGDQSIFTGISLRTLIGVLCNEWPGNVRELSKYCKQRVIFRSTETGEPNEEEHILDDEDLARKNGFHAWVCLANAVLGTVANESDQAKKEGMEIPELLRLWGVLDDIRRWRGRDMSTFDPKFYSPGLTFPLSDLQNHLFRQEQTWLTSLLPDRVQYVGEGENDAEEWPRPDIIDAGDFASMLLEVRGLADWCNLKIDNGCMLAPVSRRTRSDEWTEALRRKPEVLSLQVAIDPPGTETFEVVLKAAHLTEVHEKICRLCNEGKTGSQNAGEVGFSTSTTNEILAKIRKANAKLAPFLPPPRAGRRRKKDLSQST